MTPSYAMLLASLLIFLGYLTLVIFRHTKLPDVLFLMLFGLLLGPLAKILPPKAFMPLAPIMASVAVTIILFDAGLHLDFVQVLKQSPKAVALGVLSYGLSSAFIMLLALLARWSVFEALVLGTLLAGTSSSIVYPVIKELNIEEGGKALLTLEPILTNAFQIIPLLLARSSGLEISLATEAIISGFFIAFCFGFLFGFFWPRILKLLGGSFSYMLTLSVLLFLYSLTEIFGGNGALSILFFGLTMASEGIDKRIERFHTQVTFLTRIFFFLFLGVLIELNFQILAFSLLLCLACITARAIASSLVLKPQLSLLSSFLISKGLSEAVFASLILSTQFPRAQELLQITALTILTSNALMCFLIPLSRILRARDK